MYLIKTPKNSFSHFLWLKKRTLIPISVLFLFLLFSCQNEEELIHEENVKVSPEITNTYLTTENNNLIESKEDYLTGSISIEGTHRNNALANSPMKIRGRGNSTWWAHEKKPYQVNLVEKTSLYGMPKDKRWVFLAEHSDKTLMRNKIAFEMGYISNLDWTPQSVYSQVFMNNVYNGLYHISQKVEKGNHRVVLGETGYLLEIDQLDRLDPEDVFFNSRYFLINIKEPKVSYHSAEYVYIKNLIADFENALRSSQFSDPTVGYAKYIDVASFIDWYLINEISKNQDAKKYSSIFLNVIPDQKIKMGPLWDFDLAFGNVNYSDAEHPTGFWVKNNAWYTKLFKDPYFVDQVKTRFAYFREHQNEILEKIDTYALYLDSAQQENNTRWNVMGNWQWPNPVVLNSYTESVARLKSWYIERMNWLEIAFANL